MSYTIRFNYRRLEDSLISSLLTTITMKAICINNKNKPDDVDTSEWLKLNTIYTVENVVTNVLYNTTSLVLKEISISNPKYIGYNVSRFYCFDDVLESKLETEVKKLIEVL